MLTERIAKIEKTFLGREDHGIFTSLLTVKYDASSGQGIGGYTLDGRPEGIGSPRVGTAYGMEWIIRTIKAAGVESWEQVAGRTIIVYFDGANGPVGRPVGIGPLPTEPGTRFIFDELAAEVSA